MNVLVYSGPDVDSSTHSNTFSSLRALLNPNYAVQTVTSQALASHPWTASCALLVLPSFTETAPPSDSVHSSASIPLNLPASKEIQRYVANGGSLLAFGAALRISRGATNSIPLSTQIAGIALSDAHRPPSTQRGRPKLTLEDPDTGLRFELGLPRASPTEQASLALVDGARVGDVAREGDLDLAELPEQHKERVEVLGHLTPASDPDPSQATIPVGIQAHVGRGKAAFWGLRLEVSQPGTEHGTGATQALKLTLSKLGLSVPSPEAGGAARPTPQLLSGAPWRSGVVGAILSALEIPSNLEEAIELNDTNDKFLFHSQAQATHAFAEAQRTAYPAPSVLKHVVVYSGTSLPPRELTPRFDIATYYDELAKARAERGCPVDYPDGGWGVGEALLYTEIITSTQTMLDKNNRLLTTLPTPLVSVASAQLTGRGRGGNVWLSPPGCLMFSLLLRLPLSSFPASKIVFLQYLVALAVAEACRAESVLGDECGAHVRLKWPNDLYMVSRDGAQKKIGGVLVNTSFGAGRVDIVVGCGINVLTAPPLPALAELVPDGGERPLPTLERTLAAIMARFERMWAEFVRERGSFAPFMDLYLDRWLHSDQLVTLTTVSPPRKVRIVGITPEHGLLRTLPERDAWSDAGGGTGVEYIDLQPDGNSFDLMAGLIKTKTT